MRFQRRGRQERDDIRRPLEPPQPARKRTKTQAQPRRQAPLRLSVGLAGLSTAAAARRVGRTQASSRTSDRALHRSATHARLARNTRSTPPESTRRKRLGSQQSAVAPELSQRTGRAQPLPRTQLRRPAVSCCPASRTASAPSLPVSTSCSPDMDGDSDGESAACTTTTGPRTRPQLCSGFLTPTPLPLPLCPRHSPRPRIESCHVLTAPKR